jgi:hypothetical protein
MNDSLEFVRTRTTGVVHILASTTDSEEWFRSHFGDVDDSITMQLVLGPLPTLCGHVAYLLNRDGESGDSKVSIFLDDELCQRCHGKLGDRAYLAFEHEQ